MQKNKQNHSPKSTITAVRGPESPDGRGSQLSMKLKYAGGGAVTPTKSNDGGKAVNIVIVTTPTRLMNRSPKMVS
jgi:hypothetical protein